MTKSTQTTFQLMPEKTDQTMQALKGWAWSVQLQAGKVTLLDSRSETVAEKAVGKQLVLLTQTAVKAKEYRVIFGFVAPERTVQIFARTEGAGVVLFADDEPIAVLGSPGREVPLLSGELICVGGEPSNMDAHPGWSRISIFRSDTLTDPEQLGSLSQLLVLRIYECSSVIDLRAISEAVQLEFLIISGCEVKNYDSLEKLTSLRILFLHMLTIQNISFVVKMMHLKNLSLFGCSEWSDLSPLSGLKNLQILNLQGKRPVPFSSIGPLKGLVRLQQLKLNLCGKIRDLFPLSGLRRLRHLYLNNCEAVTRLSALRNLTLLETLSMTCCTQVRTVKGLRNLHRLKTLRLDQMSQLSNLDGYQGLIGVRKLWINLRFDISDLSPLAGLTALKDLTLHNGAALKDLSPLATLSLSRLELNGAAQVKDWSPLSKITGLEHLKLTICTLAKDLSGLSHLPLKTFELDDCESIQDLSFLASLSSLQTLVIQNCPQVKSFAGDGEFPELRKVSFVSCPNLSSLTALGQARGLQKLDVSGCSELETLDILREHDSLEKLICQQCVSLKNVDFVASHHRLRVLDIRGCSELNNISVLGGLDHLEQINLADCEFLLRENWQVLAGKSQLRHIDGIQLVFASRILANAAFLRSDTLIIRERIQAWTSAALRASDEPGLLRAAGRAAALVADHFVGRVAHASADSVCSTDHR